MTSSSGKSLLIPFLLASLCSGCAALLNQILWTRILSLVFGSTVEAVSAVTAVFMAGLALGSASGPRLVARRTAAEAAALYSRIEIGIGASALVLAFLLPALESLRASIGAAPVWLVAVVLLLVPAGLMGTTLVVQAHVVSGSRDQARSARTSGLLFAANTFGAVAGAYGSVLFLVPRLGVRNTILVATLLNVVAALLARWRAPSTSPSEGPAAAAAGPEEAKRKGRKDKAQGAPSEPAPARTEAEASGSRWSAAVVLLALFAAGFAGLVNEVAWTRAFILVAGPTVHAFAFRARRHRARSRRRRPPLEQPSPRGEESAAPLRPRAGRGRRHERPGHPLPHVHASRLWRRGSTARGSTRSPGHPSG